MNPVKKLYENLDYWLHIGIADDIIHAPDQRKEYQHIVRELKAGGYSDEAIPDLTLIELETELKLPFYKQRTFWRFMFLKIKGLFTKK